MFILSTIQMWLISIILILYILQCKSHLEQQKHNNNNIDDTHIIYKNTENTVKGFNCPPIGDLRSKITGRVVTKNSTSYNVDRLDWNERLQPTPCILVFCKNKEDVRLVVEFAIMNELNVTVRSGRHSYEVLSVENNSLVVDISAMISGGITIHKQENGMAIAIVPAGEKLVSMYAIAAKHGFSFPGGSCPTVGLGGFTLGGGYGFYSRMFGLAVDAVIAFDICLANGTFIEVNSTNAPDLYWALRGGGNTNFGVVTSISYRLEPLPQIVTQYTLEWPFDEAKEVIDAWQRFAPNAPNQLTSQLALYHTGFHSLGVLFNGTEAEMKEYIQPLLKTGNPKLEIKTMSFIDTVISLAGCSNISSCLEKAKTKPSPNGFTWKAKSTYVFEPLSSEAIDTLLEGMTIGFRNCCSGQFAGVLIDSYGGKISTVNPSETAFYSRKALYHLQYMAYWDISHKQSEEISLMWLRQFYKNMSSYVSPYAYRNYPDLDIYYSSKHDWTKVYYGSNAHRLKLIKAIYDPRNIFQGKMTITP